MLLAYVSKCPDCLAKSVHRCQITKHATLQTYRVMMRGKNSNAGLSHILIYMVDKIYIHKDLGWKQEDQITIYL
jgi:hypothetical protein